MINSVVIIVKVSKVKYLLLVDVFSLHTRKSVVGLTQLTLAFKLT